MKNQITKVDTKVYDAWQALRSSDLKEFIKSPAHYKWKMDNYEEYQKNMPTGALILGSYVHCLILEPEKVKDDFTVVNVASRNTKEYHIASAIARKEGKSVLLKKEKDQGDAMAANALSDRNFGFLVEQSFVEVSAIAKLNGTFVKSRADMWIQDSGHIIDIKTTGDDAYWFPTAVKRFGYDISAPLYVDCFSANGEKVKRYTFAVIEKNPPYGLKLFDMSPEYLEYGRRRYREALGRYLTCNANDYWPCYNNAPGNVPSLTCDEARGIEPEVANSELDN